MPQTKNKKRIAALERLLKYHSTLLNFNTRWQAEIILSKLPIADRINLAAKHNFTISKEGYIHWNK